MKITYQWKKDNEINRVEVLSNCGLPLVGDIIDIEVPAATTSEKPFKHVGRVKDIKRVIRTEDTTHLVYLSSEVNEPG